MVGVEDRKASRGFRLQRAMPGPKVMLKVEIVDENGTGMRSVNVTDRRFGIDQDA